MNHTMLAREKWQIGTVRVLERVFEERQAQVARYGHNAGLKYGTGPRVQWLTVNDADTATAKQIEKAFRKDYEAYEKENGEPTWMHLIREEVAEAFQEKDPEKLAAELVQVAALCVSLMEKLEARKADAS